MFTAPDGTTVPVIAVESLDVDDGEQIALIGSSGSGKTTLLHLIAGILTPDSGSILYRSGGKTIDLAKLAEAHRDIFRGQNIGYIFQTHHLLPGFTAMENVLLGMTFTGKAHDPAWAKHLLTEVGLADRLNYRPSKLSVGQQQRVAVARALANRPRLVLADEPTGALDPKSAQIVLDLIRKLCSEVNAALLLVTHDMEIAGKFPRKITLSELNTASLSTSGVA